MNEQEKLIAEVSQYLEGEMSDQDRQNFEQRIDQDPTLAAEVESYRSLIGALREVGQEDLRSQLRARVDEKLATEIPAAQNPWYQRPGILMLVLGLLLILTAWWVISDNENEQVQSPVSCTTQELPVVGSEQEGDGFAGTNKARILAVSICPSQNLDEEYIFNDSLQLFVKEPEDWRQVEVQFQLNNGKYQLNNQGQKYPVNRVFSGRQKLQAQ